jgi:uncharacterized protein (DUF58 family)
MIPKELFKKVREIEITTKRLVTDVFAGQYHSVFKGQGIEFEEVREYQIGDDIRTIDWNVTARSGRPHVKKFVEERELSVMILVDVSVSSRFGTVKHLKSQLAAEVAALLALSAIRNNDKVGLIVFSDVIEKFIPPRKGLRHVLRVIREILYFQPQGKATNIVAALEYLNKVTTRKTIAFLISDFFENKNNSQDNLKKALRMANKRHDVISIALNDPKEFELPDCGLLALEDAESGERVLIDSSNPYVRREYQERNQKRLEQRNRLFKLLGMDFMNISTHTSYADEIVKFFYRRQHRK